MFRNLRKIPFPELLFLTVKIDFHVHHQVAFFCLCKSGKQVLFFSKRVFCTTLTCEYWLYCRELKLNKGTILKASCDYIRQLQKDRELMLRQQQYQARLEQAARMYADRVKVSKFC